jgi:hypothetical protein
MMKKSVAFFLGLALSAAALVIAGCPTSTGNSLRNAAAPVITGQPESALYKVGDTALLRVTAQAPDGGVLSYQWFAHAGDAEPQAVPDGTASVYNPPTGEVSTKAYHVLVTNTNNGVSGLKTAALASATAEITVIPASVGAGWTAAANGANNTASSTAIAFRFTEAVADLTAEDITLADGSGSVTKGDLTGGGKDWSLGVTVEKAGDVTVSIARTGVAEGPQTVAVYKEGETVTLSYTATADGADGTTTSTGIALSFSGAVTGLSADAITLTNGTGSVAKGDLTGSGQLWSLGITVESQGTVGVAVNKEGIETAAKTVTVYKAGSADIAYDVTADGTAGTATTTSLAFAFSADVAGLAAGDLAVTNGTGVVTAGALTGSGKNWSLAVTVETAGNVTVAVTRTGIVAASKPVTVHKAGSETPEDTAYEVTANGTADSVTTTSLAFVFSADVAELAVADLTVTDGTGAVTKGALSGSGKDWTLAIDSVASAGNVTVVIAKAGIQDEVKTVAVYKAPIAYNVTANGAANVTTTTALTLTFAEAVSGLAAADITVTNGTGAVAKGALSGGGTGWTLAITAVTGAGDVTVSIGKAGIAGGGKTVTVHKGPSLTADIAFAGEEYSSGTQFDGEAWTGWETAAETWTLTALERGTVYFAVEKEASQTITVGGTDAAKVNMAESGSVDGLSASATLPVFTVDTQALLFKEGNRSFTLEVSETGALPKTVTVTLSVEINLTGAALFTVDRTSGWQGFSDDHPLTGEETLERLDNTESQAAFTGLVEAITWVNANAEANTEYLIRVERNEIDLPQIHITPTEGNVTLRLRGYNEPRILKHNGGAYSSAVIGGTYSSDGGFINIGILAATGTPPKRTLVLDDNITVNGVGAGNPAYMRYKSLIAVHKNALLVTRKGSEITGFVGRDISGCSPIQVSGTFYPGTVSSVPDRLHGYVRIEGGSITYCTVNTQYNHLISFTYEEDWTNPGAFYKAESTGDNTLVFSNNNSNMLCFNTYQHASLTTYPLTDNNVLSKP